MKFDVKIILLIFVIGFPLNLILEYLHMPFFEVHFLQGAAGSRLILSIGSSLLNILWTCLIYMIMKGIFGKTWIRNWNVLKAVTVIGVGAVFVSIGERIALTNDLWSYSVQMPLIPFIAIGLTPFLIISIGPLVTMYFASKFIESSDIVPHTQKEEYL